MPRYTNYDSALNYEKDVEEERKSANFRKKMTVWLKKGGFSERESARIAIDTDTYYATGVHPDPAVNMFARFQYLRQRHPRR